MTTGALAGVGNREPGVAAERDALAPTPQPAPLVQAEHLSKWYGQVSGLNDVTVSIPPAAVARSDGWMPSEWGARIL